MESSDEILERKEISYAKLVSRAELLDSAVVPKMPGGLGKLRESDNYLVICIPSDANLKVSVFPSGRNIKKLLIKLEQFSAQLVKGISDVLKLFNLTGDTIIHTTGLCFSGQHCFYETYLNADAIQDPEVLASVQTEFKKVDSVERSEIVDIN
jgi:hypothetical protein